MPKAEPYICPRCDYTTPLKRLMKRHLYENKNPCNDRNGLELTPAIRERILLNHKYNQDGSSGVPVSYNTINNFLGGTETMTKLNHYLQYSGKEPVDINDLVEKQYLELSRSYVC